jgi:predicted nucleotidyltransferase
MTTIQSATSTQKDTWAATLRAREAAESDALAQRRARAREVARDAANILKGRFGAEKVFLHGSLAHGLWFSRVSDVDLAVVGLDALAHLEAIARLEEIEPTIQVDLLRLEHCSEPLRASIMREGIEL